MEGEIKNFVMVWTIVLVCLCYCHIIGKFFPKGTIRFLTIFPIFCLFLVLPLNLSSINLGCVSAFLISWLTNFKLLLFAFGTGPLFSDPPIPLTRFIPLACFPIKIQHPNQDSRKYSSQDQGFKEYASQDQDSKRYPSQKFPKNGLPIQEFINHTYQEIPKNDEKHVSNKDSEEYPSQEFHQNGQKYVPDQEHKCYTFQESSRRGHKSLLNYAIKILLFGTLIKIYDYKDNLHPYILWLLYCFHIYVVLELLLAMFAAIARYLICLELEPQFDDPYLATSLQDFWGKRWNLMVSNILRPTIFEPVRIVSSHLIRKKLASLPAVVATFFVSGLMHELIFYSFQREKTNWQAMCFFMLHGVALAVEIGVKKMVKGKFRLPAAISIPLTLMFVIVSSFWLFFPPFFRGNAEAKACTETLAFIEFVKHGHLVSPNNFICPFL